MKPRDFFPSTDAWRSRQAELSADRRRFIKNPRETVRAALHRELDRVRQQIHDECGYARPLRSADINAARARVAKIFDFELAPIAPLPWEFPGHDDDPAWPALFTHSLRNVLIAKYGDPDREPLASDLLAAATEAAEDLHAIARAQNG